MIGHLTPDSLCVSRFQRSFLTIAWAHICRVYVCDESTASIDEGSNAIVHDELLSLPATVFFVCHRLEVRHAASNTLPLL